VSASSEKVGEARKILAEREPAELREDPEGVAHV